MLAIRMQRTGRKGHAMFRVVVQDSRRTPTSGKVVAQIGSYDPHAKTVVVDKEKATFYLTNGAQPSGRVALLLKAEGVKLPDWVRTNDGKTGKIRNSEKLRRNRPAEPVEEVVAEVPAEEPVVEAAAEPETAPLEVAETETEAPATEETPVEKAEETEEKVAK
jgi:small subunit ribosomal protein S16